MILVPCPYCGPRNASEFRWCGEVKSRPDSNRATPEQWRDYLYLKSNGVRMDHGDLVPSRRMRPILSHRTPYAHQRDSCHPVDGGKPEPAVAETGAGASGRR